ncbi:MAG: MerC domain-containing protein [Allosphingosinicella sp.]|uniref:MerC domain-containing protein n=1 Tax=Allosphingosinicella sp. TaxID=2823234 RepID=UPI003930D303
MNFRQQRTPYSEPTTSVSWPDRLAIGASTACVAHCLLVPILIVIVPATSRWLALPEEVHMWAFATAVPVSAYAMRRGYEHHGLLLPAALGVIGLVLLGIGALFGLARALETGFTLGGSVALIVAHIQNWQLRGRRSAGAVGNRPLVARSGAGGAHA